MKDVITLDNEETSLTLATPAAYLAAATSHNTRRAYQCDIRHFEAWGGRLPANRDSILRYLHAFATQLNSRTLARRLTALRNWHEYQGFQDPTSHPSVSKTLAGIMRTHGKPKDKAPPLLPEQLTKIVYALKQDSSLRALRDNALLQTAFFGAFRQSEVVAIHYEHLQWQEQGVDILLPHSKTDQLREGLSCAIPYGNDELCAVHALEQWIAQAGINSGPIFCRLYPDNRLADKALSVLSVSLILRKRAEEAGIPHAADFTSHSLRRGLATAASRDGASLPAIMRQGRWKNVNTVMEYIDAAQRFEENAAGSILKKSS